MRHRPRLLIADASGNIFDDPYLLMAARRGTKLFVPGKEDVAPLPPESELFLLPGRNAIGYDKRKGKFLVRPQLAVAAFAAPGHTLDAHPAYATAKDAPILPLFAYGAVGYADDRFWICARKVDNEPRQVFSGVKPGAIERNCGRLLKDYPRNRLVDHIINNCVRRYACPAARNFALGRFEAPLPTSRTCNARCLGCISNKTEDSPISATPQCRLGFTPTADEIIEVMRIHESREKTRPIYSFGQGCEGDPLLNAGLLARSVSGFRALGGSGTINCNTNASIPEAVELLARSGLTSLRASLNSARPEFYEAYYRPAGYSFGDVRQSLSTARRLGVHVALNLLYFPGITDSPAELDALAHLCHDCGVAMIQWRNLNIDPEWYPETLRDAGVDARSDAMGLGAFMESLKGKCPWLTYGYFNPWLGDKAEIAAPMPTGV